MKETEIPGSRRVRHLNIQKIPDAAEINPSLFYGKFAAWKPYEKKDSDKTDHVAQLIKQGGWCDPKKLAVYLHSGAKTFEMITATRLLIGRGTPSVFEQGISLHPLFGLPFLPGSAVKGVTAHWAAANGEDAELREQIFGPQTEDEEKAQGKVVFLDAVPLKRQCLEKDVLAPHYPKYYSGEADFPSDQESPNVFFFPAVKREVVFQFAVQLAAAAKGEEQLLVTAQEWIKAALQDFGIGSKTGSNYGYFNKSPI
jgi:CRISPR-associated protein Cmr6